VLHAVAVLVPLVLGAAVTPASSAGFSPERVDAIVREVMATNGAPGVAVAVVHHGTVVYVKGLGMRDVGGKLPVEPDTPFAIGSVSKQFTATAVLLLAQDGKLHLDDRLASFGVRLANADTITLRELLNQTSGLHNYPLTTEHAWPLQGNIPTRQIIDILKTDQPDFAPGTRWAYSNSNYAALTAVVERVSGKPMAAFLQERIFAPAGMREAGFGRAAQQRPQTALAYRGVVQYQRQEELSADLFSGAGAVYASARDLARWDLTLLEHRILTPASRDLLFSRGTLNDGAPVHYAMGFVPDVAGGHRLVWHNGLAPGAGGYCYNAIFPDDGLAIAVVSNGYDFAERPERIMRGIFRVVFPL
jgi:D-alanyl-D-alanine carboxypeptidase